jgi:hypothetical protein
MRRRWIGTGGNEWIGMSERLLLEKKGEASRGRVGNDGRPSVRRVGRPSRSIAQFKKFRIGKAVL